MVYKKLKKYFTGLLKEHGLEKEKIEVRARPLTSEEAIGTPGEDDYPLLEGRERLMEAIFRDSPGQAYTDFFGNFSGLLGEISRLKLKDNFRRAVFISTLNAVMRDLGLVEGTIHCRDSEPAECGWELIEYLQRFRGVGKVALFGLQPRLLEAIVQGYRVRATDLDPDNIGRVKEGVTVEPPNRTEELLGWCDLALVTGTTVVNGTIEKFLGLNKPTVFYGVSIAGPARVLGLSRFCAFGH